VTGSLFGRRSSVPRFSAKARTIVPECSALDWSWINPDISSIPIGGLDSGCTTCNPQVDIHFSETKHLPYGEGRLRVGPLRNALGQFARPATIISGSSDEASSQAIRAVLQSS
jgi:hypothetical protein